jgi:hypothetical protein
VEKLLDLALKNSTRSDFIAFWSSDGDEIEILRVELDARLRAFGVCFVLLSDDGRLELTACIVQVV